MQWGVRVECLCGKDRLTAYVYSTALFVIFRILLIFLFYYWYLVIASDCRFCLLFILSISTLRTWVQLTSWLLQFFAAEFGCGDGCWVVAWGIIWEHEVAVAKDGANALLCCLSHLQNTDIIIVQKPQTVKVCYSGSIEIVYHLCITITTSGGYD